MSSTTLVSLHNVTKVFGDVTALDSVDFSVRRGEIHGLLGENGAGKSTLMKILYGLYAPDSGSITMDGEEVHITAPYDSIKLGIGMVHQVSTLVPEFTALENIIMGTKGDTFTLPIQRDHARIAEISQKYGLPFPLDTKVVELSAGIKQKVEIVRALCRGAKLLILDEPTTSLVESEFEQLLESLRALVSGGVTVIFITHKIREVMRACDMATVLRKGRVQGQLTQQEMTQQKLVKLMFSEKDIEVNESALPTVDLPPSSRSAHPVLSLRNVSVRGSEESAGLLDVTLDVHGGEILGVAAVSGNGEKEIAEIIVNPREMESGDILLEGESIAHLSTLEVFSRGVAYTPEDRNQDGILPDGNMIENMLLGHQAETRFSRSGGFVAWPQVREATETAIGDYNIYTPSADLSIRRLSGGNVQKAILARAFMGSPRLLVTHNPTTGLDVSTVEFIFRRLVDLRSHGAAIFWVNEDLDELMIISDRIAVMHDGTLRGVFDRTNFDKYHISLLMLGGE